MRWLRSKKEVCAMAVDRSIDSPPLPLPALLVLTFFKAFWKLCSGFFSFRASTLLNEMKSARSAMARKENEVSKTSKSKKGKEEMIFRFLALLFSFFSSKNSTPSERE